MIGLVFGGRSGEHTQPSSKECAELMRLFPEAPDCPSAQAASVKALFDSGLGRVIFVYTVSGLLIAGVVGVFLWWIHNQQIGREDSSPSRRTYVVVGALLFGLAALVFSFMGVLVAILKPTDGPGQWFVAGLVSATFFVMYARSAQRTLSFIT